MWTGCLQDCFSTLIALWSPNDILLLVLRNCTSIINPEFFSRPLLGPSVTLSAAASYVRMFPLDLVHLSSFFFTGLKPLLSSSIKSFSYTLDFTFIILTPSSREWVTQPVKWSVTSWRTGKSGFESQQCTDNFLFSEESRSSFGRIQLSIQWETGSKAADAWSSVLKSI
jgi:hypothetical protein